ncbi:MAG TPA: HD domain-containing protein, partial [Roseiflexaceae bacterium]|nr:HD domain-containing protein [Roseiflexaceae bacterium]
MSERDAIERLLAHVRPVLEAIERAGGRPLVVGGAVRDALLGLPPHDVDVEVYGLEAGPLAQALAALGRVEAVGRAFGVLKLWLPGGRDVDVALPQRRSRNPSGERGFIAAPDPAMTPAEAAARRDFTWNAMALTPAGELLDPFGGAADLHAGIIRHASGLFGEDPLRVLRAVQFAARFDMRLAPETAAVCRALLPEAASLPPSRVWGEWQKWALKGIRPSAGLRALQESGWLALYPELEALVGCPQPAQHHPEGDVWTHTGHVCDWAARLAEREHLTADAREVLLFAALCHDLGKPATTVLGPDGQPRSPGHAQAGVPLTQALLERFDAPKHLGQRVVPLVREHMAHMGAAASERAVRRLSLRLVPATIALWDVLAEADCSGR